MTNQEIMFDARNHLRGRWKEPVLIFLIYAVFYVVFVGAVPKVGPIINLLVSGPITLGMSIYFLKSIRGQPTRIEDVLQGFSSFGRALITYLLMIIFILLWLLLLIVPGIIAAISYSMTFYVMADDNQISATDAIRKSKSLMEGSKWKYFCFLLRFSGWFILCILSLGIGFLWLGPYFMTSNAKFYEQLNTSKVALSV